jgi:phosphoribosylformylglycinamidine (FGAM) synthase PurS component
MVVLYHLDADDSTVPDILTLCNEAKERGGYHLHNGWVHDYLVTKATELGLDAHREENITDLSKIKEYLMAGNPVIVSVEKRVLEQTRFHMVVLVGYEEVVSSASDSLLPHTPHSTPCIFYYHETESTDKEKGQYRKVSEEQFMEYFRGKAIFISKKQKAKREV